MITPRPVDHPARRRWRRWVVGHVTPWIGAVWVVAELAQAPPQFFDNLLSWHVVKSVLLVLGTAVLFGYWGAVVLAEVAWAFGFRPDVG
jgi:hypothetical protein